MMRACDIVRQWKAVQRIFCARKSRPSEWLKLMEVIAAADSGVTLAELRGPKAATQNLNMRTVRRWQAAGLITTALDTKPAKQPGRSPLRLFATAKAALLLHVTPERVRETAESKQRRERSLFAGRKEAA